METNRHNIVANLTWKDVEARLAAGAAAILPVGAGAKEHGLHLPMNTDQIQAEWLAGVIAAEIDALIWPTLSYGYYPAFVRYAGSVSLSDETFQALIRETVSGLIGFGAKTVLVLDTGISTIPPIDAALASLDQGGRAHHLKIHAGPRYGEAVKEHCTQSYGSHADEAETSRMLVLAPEAVDMGKAEASPADQGNGRGPLSPDDPTAPAYSPSGSWGDPTKGSREKGEALLAAMAADVVEMAKAANSA